MGSRNFSKGGLKSIITVQNINPAIEKLEAINPNEENASEKANLEGICFFFRATT